MPLQIEDSAIDQIARVLSAFEESKKHEDSAKNAELFGVLLDSTNKAIDSTIKILDQFFPKEKDSNSSKDHPDSSKDHPDSSKNHSEIEARRDLVIIQAGATALSAITGFYKSYHSYQAAKKAPTKGIADFANELIGKQTPVDFPALKNALNKHASSNLTIQAKANADKAVEYAGKATAAVKGLTANNLSAAISNIAAAATKTSDCAKAIQSATKTSQEAINAIAAINAALDKVNMAGDDAKNAKTFCETKSAPLDVIQKANEKATTDANTAKTEADNLSTISDTTQIQNCLTTSQNALKGSIKAEKDATAYKDAITKAITKANNAQSSAKEAEAEATEAKKAWDEAQ